MAATSPSEVPENIAIVTNPIWATDEYATNFLASVCLQVDRLAYITAIDPNKIIMGEKYWEAAGKSVHENLKKPYPPNLSSTPANRTDPATGASTWACGNQI